MGVPPPVDEQPVRQFVVHDATVAAALLVVMSVGPLWTRTVPRTRDGVGTVPEDFLDRLCAVGTEFRQFPSVCSHRSRRRHSRFHRHCQRPISGFLATHTEHEHGCAAGPSQNLAPGGDDTAGQSEQETNSPTACDIMNLVVESRDEILGEICER